MNLNHYITARLDIENKGFFDNKIEQLYNSDDESFVYYQNSDSFVGEYVVIQSFKCILDLKIRCVGDGKLNIKLRSIEVINKSGNSLPIFINFTNVLINGVQYIDNDILVSYNDFYQFPEFDVENNDIVDIHLEWEPFNFDFNNDLIKFKLESDELALNNFNQGENFNDELVKENEFTLNEKKGICEFPKVSIIIPVFNPGKLLYKCLDSVINQSLNEIEIICVDDGSTDDSLEILYGYAREDSRFRIFHQENNGAGTARNKAINESKGEFLIFLDSDDWIEEDMCEKLYIQAQKLNSDLVIFNALWHTIEGIQEFNYFSEDDFKEDYTSFTFDYHFILNRLMVASYGVIWSRFYRSSFIKNNEIKFPKHKIYNDVEFCFKTALLAKNISYCPEYFYHYIKMGQPSLQTSFREGKDELIWFDVLNGLYDIFVDYNFMEEFRVDFINYCIYYSIDKLKNISVELRETFLNNMKSFFMRLDPTSNELNTLKSRNLTWYTSITLNLLPLYDAIMFDNLEYVELKLCELKLLDSKKELVNTSYNSKDDVFQQLKKDFVSSNFGINIINQLPLDLYNFYISVLNFESYHNFDLFNEYGGNNTFKFIKTLWYDVNNSKEVSDYIVTNEDYGNFSVVDDYKQLEVYSSDLIVLRVLSLVIEGNFEIIFEIKVTDYANFGISSYNSCTNFSYVRITNKNWLFYRLCRIDGSIKIQVSTNENSWEDINLDGDELDEDKCQFQFNCGYSNFSDKRVMVRNIKIFEI